jgi:hypothetical protein
MRNGACRSASVRISTPGYAWERINFFLPREKTSKVPSLTSKVSGSRLRVHYRLWCAGICRNKPLRKIGDFTRLENLNTRVYANRYAGLRGFIRLYAGGRHFSTRINPPNHSRKVAYSESPAAYCRLFCEAAYSGTPQPVVYPQTTPTIRQTHFLPPSFARLVAP